jgi:hypothetical protein
MNVNTKLNSSNAYAILKLAQKEASAGGIHFSPVGASPRLLRGAFLFRLTVNAKEA